MLRGNTLFLTCVKKALGMDLRPLSPPHLNQPLLTCGGRGLMKRKIYCTEFAMNTPLVGIDYEAALGLWVHGLC
jgi:hypothetical protein